MLKFLTVGSRVISITMWTQLYYLSQCHKSIILLSYQWQVYHLSRTWLNEKLKNYVLCCVWWKAYKWGDTKQLTSFLIEHLLLFLLQL